ncbi:TPA: hypothetical protein SID20_000735 [Pasteurella multocida]|uniref:hypothetical protein n=1 Tax=Pasteurella multocida TaxID=747 RepID=UPI000DF8D235|nr:hypothetical protein [Pasteurella multocida]MCL7786200.1 hypothetical protein [Pasteurella multocida]MDC4237582.1 hypothetical protein [Pasteurella multocida]URI02925.1 hypothetical protein M8852_01170 [Pasteurella multocida]SUB46207.1 Uncharacterised protein [Pasteurella multocida subsp. septica]HDR0635502.1 hypothetical protein [Pasteurella multocida]
MKTSKLSYRKWFTIEELKNLLSSKTGLNFTAKQVLEKFKHDIYFHVKFDWEIDEYLIINGKQHKNTCILFKKNPNPFLANEAEIRAIYEIKQEAEFISESKETYLLLIKNKQQELIEEYGEIAIYNFKGYLNVPNIAIISDNLALTDENHLALPEYYHYDTNELLPSLHIENVSFIPNFIYLTFKSGSNFIHLSDLRIDADSVYDFLNKIDSPTPQKTAKKARKTIEKTQLKPKKHYEKIVISNAVRIVLEHQEIGLYTIVGSIISRIKSDYGITNTMFFSDRHYVDKIKAELKRKGIKIISRSGKTVELPDYEIEI